MQTDSNDTSALGPDPLRVVVCIKQVPDAAELRFDNKARKVIRDGVRNIINPFDRRAVAEGLRLARMSGGDLTVVTMGPPQAREALVECLAAGADHAVHLMDQLFAGSDTLATARALAYAVKRIPFDLILCGKHSIDAETGQVGPELAELLGIPHVTGVCSLGFDCAPGYVIAERETDDGFETVQCALPVLITAAERLVKPIKVKEPDIEAARGKPIQTVTAADLDCDVSLLGEAGSPTSVSEIFHLESSRTIQMLTGDVEQIAAELVNRLCERGMYSGWGVSEEADQESIRLTSSPSSEKEIWVIAEVAARGVRPATFEMLGKATELAAELEASVAAVLIGESVSRYANELAAHGADKIYLIEGDGLSLFNPLQYTGELVAAVSRFRPYAVLISSSSTGRDYAPRIAARLGLGLTADCVGLELNSSGELVQLKPAFGGQIIAPILSKTWPQMATVRAGIFARPKPDWSRIARIERIDGSMAPDARYRVTQTKSNGGEAAIELDTADAVVCVGMGAGAPENLECIRTLAAELGAALAGTRRVVDAGWLPRQRQIGLTGRSVAPKLYLAIGVRGNFNHSIGIRRAGIVGAVNTDPEAEIFKCADFGVVADFAEFVPALVRALERAKSNFKGAERGSCSLG
jgi:electron transfer flavoprotein alpha subunit